jgi:Peptidase propeptide and YPEB domain
MQKRLIVAVVAAATCAGLPALAATDAECQAMWTRADTNKDGKLSDAEAQRYLAMMRVHDYKKVPANNDVDQASFMEACKADVFAPQKAETGAPLKGANSFTEGQARDRAMAHGFGNVGGLKKDDDGIWRGQATADDGKPVEIAVDYKGNVVPTTKSR